MLGDGFSESMEEMERHYTLSIRGDIQHQEAKYYAERGIWHHGGLNVIHRTGYVGLTLLFLWFIFMGGGAWRLCMYSRKYTGREYVYMNSVYMIVEMVLFYWYSGGWTIVYQSIFYKATVAKILYSVARKEGIIPPIMLNNRYVPMIMSKVT